MKILKVKVRQEKNQGVTHHIYPTKYDSKKIQVLCYEDETEKNNRNDGTIYLIGVVKNEDATKFLLSSDIEEITQVEANALGVNWRPQVEKITDEKKVLNICAKAIRGEPLTQEEKDSLDPNKPEIGINKSKAFNDLLEEQLNR